MVYYASYKKKQNIRKYTGSFVQKKYGTYKPETNEFVT